MTPTEAREAERERSQRRGFLLPAEPVVGGIRLRPFSLWTLDFCDEVGLPFFTDPSKPSTGPIKLRKSEQLSALLWGHEASRSRHEIDDHLFAGTWPEEIRDFHRRPDIARAAKPLRQYIGYVAALIDAASVKIRPPKLEKGETRKKEPKDLLHPAGRTALIWAVGGSEVQTAEQLDFLYAGMWLPVLLQFYHAACREAQLHTVAPTRRDPKTLKASRDAVVEAARASAASAEEDDFF